VIRRNFDLLSACELAINLVAYCQGKPLGRQETWKDSPEGHPQTPPYKWWKWHDNYDAEASPDPKWVKVSDAGEATFRKRDAEAKAS
jgi:hypothetical protein